VRPQKLQQGLSRRSGPSCWCSVPYVSPERVQDDTWIRVLLAKDAISSGWDRNGRAKSDSLVKFLDDDSLVRLPVLAFVV
jgi:hypothetical protein